MTVRSVTDPWQRRPSSDWLAIAVLAAKSGAAWGCLAALPLFSQDSAAPLTANVRTDSPQLMVVASDEEAIFIEFQFESQKEGVYRRWRDDIDAAVASHDVDKNHLLNEDELWRLSASGLLGDRAAIVDYDGRNKNILLIRPSVDDAAGGVTAASLTADLLTAGCGPVRLECFPDSEHNLGALFLAIDRNRDGQLSAAECARAQEVIDIWDRDQSETIDASVIALSQPSAPTPNVSPPALVCFLGAGSSASDVAQRMLDQLGVASELGRRAPRTALGYPSETFARFDRDGDGGLDLDELQGLLRAAPAHAQLFGVLPTELRLKLSPEVPEKTLGMQAVRIDSGGVASTQDGQVALSSPRMKINWQIAAGSRRVITKNLKQVFEKLDLDKNGFLDADERRRSADLQWARADIDHDDKLTFVEVETFFSNATAALRKQWRISITDYGRSLFAALDANQDDRLGRRELSALPRRFVDWDVNHDGQIDPKEIPHSFVARVSPESVLQASDNLFAATPARAPTVATRAQPAGPLWFHSMDRNQDGDVSPREFLGPPTVFRQLDANGDDLIDASEAWQIPAKLIGSSD